MANPRPTAAHPGDLADSELVGCTHVANDPSAAPEARADEMDDALEIAPIDDTGPLEADDDYTGDWRSDFGDSVGISSWRTL